MIYSQLRQDIRQEVRFRFHGLPRTEVEEADLHELVDYHMPVYAVDLMELAREEPHLVFAEASFLARDAKLTPFNALVANVFEQLILEAEDERRAMLEETEG